MTPGSRPAALVATAGVAAVLAFSATGASGAPSASGAAVRVPCADGEPVKLAPPSAGLYHGAYTSVDPYGLGLGGAAYARALKRFAGLAGKRPAIATIIDFWFAGRIEFPAEQVEAIWRSGAFPRVMLMPMSSWAELDRPSPYYSLQNFLDGNFDAALSSYARAVRDSGVPVMLEFGNEVNAGWPWSAQHNGAGETEGYGDPDAYDGQERFRDAYRHVVEIFRAEGASSVTWAFHVSPEGPEPWNRIAGYYPGDEYVDWIGASVYGALPPVVRSKSFRRRMDSVYASMAALSPSRPLAVFEYATVDRRGYGNKARWTRSALRDLRSGRWPRVKAAIWWHEKWRERSGLIDFRINSSAGALTAYRRGIAPRALKAKPLLACE